MENTNEKDIRKKCLIDEDPLVEIEDKYPREKAQEEELMYDNGPEKPAEARSNRAVKGSAWLLGIVAIFAIAILIGLFVGKRNSNKDEYSVTTKEYAMKSGANVNNKVIVDKVSVLSATETVADNANGNTNGAATGSVTDNSAASTTAVSGTTTVSDQDRIEEEAREVIHGDFGNNPGRKAKLGADYAAVQARVNQILH